MRDDGGQRGVGEMVVDKDVCEKMVVANDVCEIVCIMVCEKVVCESWDTESKTRIRHASSTA